MNRLALTVAACLAITGQVAGQSIKGHYVAKTEADGTIYHTFPSALFENKVSGDLVFDITYKSNSEKRATINFTYTMKTVNPVDSVRFVCGATRIDGSAAKIYISPEKKSWKHRYTFSADLKSLSLFFVKAADSPSVTLYIGGKVVVFNVKPSAWNSYAPIGNKILEMIRMNERY